MLLLAVPALLLGLAEAALRLAGYGYPTSFLVSRDGGRTYTPNEHFTRQFMAREIATRGDAFCLPARKPSGTFRIFVLGGSAALGVPNSSFGLPRVLECMLRHRWPEQRFEVVNAAVMGIDSHAVVSIARDCAAREGDLFVVYLGNNEAVGPHSPVTTPGILTASPAVLRGWLWCRSTKVGQLVQAGAEALGAGADAAESQDMEYFLSHAMGPDDPRRLTVAEHFGANLREVCRVARAAGARVVLSTVATNLQTCAPFASEHRTGITGEQADAWRRGLREGEVLEQHGLAHRALDRYRQALALDDRHADLHYRLGRCLWGLGQRDRAFEHWARARDLDALPFRATAELNRVVRTVAAEFRADGVVPADAAEAFRRRAAEHVARDEPLFYDHCHLTFEGNYELARALLPAVEAALPEAARSHGSRAGPTLQRCAERLGLTDWHRFHMAAIMVRATGKPPFTHQSDHARQHARLRRLSEDLARNDSPAGRAEAMRRVASAAAQSPGDYRLRQSLAMLQASLGRHGEAASSWGAVLRVFPYDTAMRLRLADALLNAGRLDEAQGHYAKVLDAEPGSAGAERGLGLLDLIRGNPAEAKDHFEAALADTADPAAYGWVARAFLRHNRPAEAKAWFQRGLARAPTDARLHAGLAELLLAGNRPQEAAEHFRSALAADPALPEARAGLPRARAAAMGRSVARQDAPTD